MQLIALDDLNRGLDPLHHAVGKGLASVATINQYAFNQRQIRLRAVNGPQCAVPVGHIGRGRGDGVGQALYVDRDVTLDAGDLLPAS